MYNSMILSYIVLGIRTSLMNDDPVGATFATAILDSHKAAYRSYHHTPDGKAFPLSNQI
jgi:hypothetical protein